MLEDLVPKPDETEFQESTHNSDFYRGDRKTGLAFGRGGDFSVRIYDKTEQLQVSIREAESAERRLRASEKAAREAEVWARAGWQAGEPVTRVEVQVRGTALHELCRRCEVRVRDASSPEDHERAIDEAEDAMVELSEHLLDQLWQYTTRRWIRQIDPDAKTRTGKPQRRTRCPSTEWWTEVQSVVFRHPNEPVPRRVRRRSCVRSSQAMGSAMSLATLHGHLSPWVEQVWTVSSRSDPRWDGQGTSPVSIDPERGHAMAAKHLETRQYQIEGPVPQDLDVKVEWKCADEERAAKQADHLGVAGLRLKEEIARVFEFIQPVIYDDLVTMAGSERLALERFITRFGAASCRFQPDNPDRPRTDIRHVAPRVATGVHPPPN